MNAYCDTAYQNSQIFNYSHTHRYRRLPRLSCRNPLILAKCAIGANLAGSLVLNPSLAGRLGSFPHLTVATVRTEGTPQVTLIGSPENQQRAAALHCCPLNTWTFALRMRECCTRSSSRYQKSELVAYPQAYPPSSCEWTDKYLVHIYRHTASYPRSSS